MLYIRDFIYNLQSKECLTCLKCTAMRKILFVMFAALAFVACEKEELPKGTEGVCINYENGIEFPHLDIVNGDDTTFSTSHSAYVCSVWLYADDPAEDVEYRFEEDSKVCDFDIGTIKTLDNKLFEVNINPISGSKYKAIAVELDTTPQIKVSKGAFLAFFDR